MTVIDQPHVVHDHAVWASRSVTLLCGPPGSGKSTLAESLHQRTVEVEHYADADTIREQLRRYGKAVFTVGKRSTPDAAVVRCAASIAERQHHERLCRPSRTIVLLVDAAECHRRIDERNRPTAAGEHAAVDEWWRVWNAEHG